MCAGGCAASAMAMARERRDMVVAMARRGRETAQDLGAGGRSGREKERRKKTLVTEKQRKM